MNMKSCAYKSRKHHRSNKWDGFSVRVHVSSLGGIHGSILFLASISLRLSHVFSFVLRRTFNLRKVVGNGAGNGTRKAVVRIKICFGNHRNLLRMTPPSSYLSRILACLSVFRGRAKSL